MRSAEKTLVTSNPSRASIVVDILLGLRLGNRVQIALLAQDAER
jgi:hypothetical protein